MPIPVAAYLRIRHHVFGLLRETGGKLKKLPSERELSRQFKVSRGTVQKALKALVKEGHLIACQGSGLYANPDRELVFRASGENPRIVLIMGDGMTTYYAAGPAEVMGLLSLALAKQGIDFNLPGLSGNPAADIKEILSVRPLGVIWYRPGVMGKSVIQELLTRNIPVITLDMAEAIPGAANITTDFRAVGRLAAEKLLERGHRVILFCGQVAEESSIERNCHAGFKEGLAARGLNQEPKCIFSDLQGFDRWLRERLGNGPEFTAVFLAHRYFLRPLMDALSAGAARSGQRPETVLFGQRQNLPDAWPLARIECPVAALTARAAELAQTALKTGTGDLPVERLAPIWVEAKGAC